MRTILFSLMFSNIRFRARGRADCLGLEFWVLLVFAHADDSAREHIIEMLSRV
jgi:hypothetical protein